MPSDDLARRVLFISVSDISAIFGVSRTTAYQYRKMIVENCQERGIEKIFAPTGQLIARHVREALGLTIEEWRIAEAKIWEANHRR